MLRPRRASYPVLTRLSVPAAPLMLTVACFASCSADAPILPSLAAAQQCVVGGEDAELGAAPNLGRLLVNDVPTCSVTLVTSSAAVTAGHCVAGREPGQLVVVFGDLGVSEQEASEQLATVRSITLFPDWGTDTGVLIDNDLALLEFEQEVQEVDEVHPLELATTEGACSGELVGWGALSPNELGAEHAQSVRLELASEETCANHLEELGEADLRDRIFCAGAESGTPGSCHGDSGSPLLGHVDGKTVALGFALGGGQDCDEYSLFASAEYYKAWIEGVLGN
jgi:secreted trypsin-like serine protease